MSSKDFARSSSVVHSTPNNSYDLNFLFQSISPLNEEPQNVMPQIEEGKEVTQNEEPKEKKNKPKFKAADVIFPPGKVHKKMKARCKCLRVQRREKNN
jgi:hypothetical protein